MCFRMFNLLLNKMDYDCHNAQLLGLGMSLLIETVRSDLPLRGHNYTESVTPLFDRLTHDAPLEFSPYLNQPLP